MTFKDFEILAELLVVVVVLIDMSGFIDELKGWLRRWLGIRGEISLKPLDCSFCMYHWTALVAMLCLSRLTLATYTAICVGCLLTLPVQRLFTAILDGFTAILERLWRKS